MASRQEYLIIVPEAARQAELGACDEALRVLSPDLRRANVDAFSDYRDLDAAVTGDFDDLRRRRITRRTRWLYPLES